MDSATDVLGDMGFLRVLNSVYSLCCIKSCDATVVSGFVTKLASSKVNVSGQVESIHQ